MTPEETRQAAAVMLAFADGKRIEVYDDTLRRWRFVPEPNFTWGASQYRVAPEPWQGKIWVHPDGSIGAFDPDVNDECWTKHGWRLINAKEVADE